MTGSLTHHFGLQVSITLMLLSGSLLGLDLTQQSQQGNLTTAGGPAEARPAEEHPQSQVQASMRGVPPTTRSQLQLGGKCASKGSCSRVLASRRRDLNSGSDKQACYCDRLCASYDDCCRDSPWAEPLERRLALSADKLRERRKTWQCRRVNEIFGDVLLRAACQVDWLARQRDKGYAATIKQRCETNEPGPWQQADPLGSLMPITDLTSGISYANSYCLRCNPDDARLIAASNSNKDNKDNSKSNSSKQEKQKLIYWSPVVNCNYNSELDDRNSLYDLISLKKGRALRYSRRRNKWLISARHVQSLDNSTNGSYHTSHSAPLDAPLNEDLASQRVCSIQPTVPSSVEHLIRHCRARTIDRCPEANQTISSEDMQQARSECHFGHQSLVYSQTSDRVYFNLACARCHQERQVLCEPRTLKQLAGAPQNVNRHSAPGVLSSPSDQLGGMLGNQLDTPLEAGARSGGDSPGQGSFSVLMDLYGGGQGDAGSEQVGAIHGCADAERQVYDPFLLTCRDIVCGLNHRFVDGSCVQVDASGTTNLLSLNLTLPVNGTTQENGPQRTTASSTTPAARQQQLGGSAQVQVASASSSSSQSADKGQAGASSTSGTPSASDVDSTSTPTATTTPMAGADAEARLVVGWNSEPNSTTDGQREDESQQLQQQQHRTTRSDNGERPFVELLASLQLDELPQPTSESRRAFAECAKIFIRPEHYRLFTLADLRASASSVNSSLTARGQAAGDPSLGRDGESAARPGRDLKFLSASDHQRRAESPRLSWELSQNTWALVSPYNLTLDSSQFELVRDRRASSSAAGQPREQEAFELLVCSPFKSDLVAKFKPTMVYLTTCCLVVSITSLVLFLLLYALSVFDLRHLVVELTQAGHVSDALKTNALDSKFRDSRASSDTSYNAARSQSLSSRGVACLAAALLAAYLLFILGHQQQQRQEQQASVSPGSLTSCTIIAAATYCSFLMAFSWMFLLSYDIWRTLKLATCQLRTPTMSSQSRRFFVYALCACGFAMSLTALALLVDQLNPLATCTGGTSQSSLSHPADELQGPPSGATCGALQTELERLLHIYRPKFGRRSGSCWFSNRRSLALFFGAPVTLIMFVNLLFFLHSSFMVIKTSSRSSRRLAATNSNCSTSSQNSLGCTIVTTTTASSRAAGDKHAQQQQLSDQAMDFAHQNGMTTSSMASVKTIQSNLSLRSESDFVSYESSPPGGAAQSDTTSTPRDASETDESETADRDEEEEKTAAGRQATASQIQIQIEQIGEASRRLGEREQQHYCATRQESSSSLISAGSRSLAAGANSSLAANLAQKYDLHLNNLSSFMSSIVKDYRLYCRLSTIMGLTWLTGLMASVVDQSELLWYLFVVLNTLQGLFIFVAFGFKRSRLTNVEILFNYLRFRLKSGADNRRPCGERPTKGADF